MSCRLCPAGAVACRLRVYDTALCLLSAHLSSGENEGDELTRNYDYSEIVRRGAFPADVAAVDPAAALPGQQQDGIAKVCVLGTHGVAYVGTVSKPLCNERKNAASPSALNNIWKEWPADLEQLPIASWHSVHRRANMYCCPEGL